MEFKFKKVLLQVTLVTAISVNAMLPAAYASEAATPAKNFQAVSVTSLSVTTDGKVEAAGKWGWIVKGALYAIKYGLKAGDYVFKYLVKWLDTGTTRYLSNNSSKVIKGIDNAIGKLDDLTTYTTGIVRQIVLDGLRIAGVPDTYGVAIADAIATTVDWLVL